MKGFGIPELVIILGLLIVLIAGFLPSGNLTAGGETLLVGKMGGILGSKGFDYEHISIADSLTLSKGIEGAPLLLLTGPVEIAKGLVTTQEREIEFAVPSQTSGELSSAALSMKILDTNGYGPLKVYLNGEEVWSGFATKDQLLEVPLPIEKISLNNRIKISAGSSGWKIWSPTYYMIETIKVSEQVTSGEEKTLGFTLTDDQLSGFDRGRVYIGNVVSSASGEIAIILNDDRVIFRGVPGQGSFINTFSSGVKNNNTLTFRLLEDGHYQFENIEVIVFTSGNETGGFSAPFTITSEDYAKLVSGQKQGVIEVEVLEDANNILEVLISGEKDTTIYRDRPQKGTLLLYFTVTEVSRENILVIRSSGEYNLGMVTAKLVNK